MKLSSMAILLVAVGAMMIPAMPFAMAMPDPSSSPPDPAVQNGFVTLTFGQSANVDELFGQIIRVYDEPEDDILAGGVNRCIIVPGPDDAAVSETVWELRDKADTDKVIGYEFVSGDAPVDVVTVDFGTNVGSSTSSTFISVTGNSKILSDGSDVGSTQEVVWVEITDNAGTKGTTEPSTDRVGEYAYRSCSDDSTDTFNVGDHFDIELPIGGELLPISMAVLLVNGVSQSAFWLISLVGAGAVFTLIGFQVHKKQHKSL